MVDDLLDWVVDVEGKLANDDVGKDLPSVQQLVKKQQVMCKLCLPRELLTSDDSLPNVGNSCFVCSW